MGFQVGGSCYGSAGAAAAAAASSQGGAVLSLGTSAYVVSVDSTSDTAIGYRLTPVGGGSALTVTAPYSALPCGLLEWGDGITLAWLVVGAWVAAVALMALVRAVRD